MRPDGKEKADEEKLYPPAGMSVQHCLNLLNRLGRLKWHADIEPSYEHANGVFKYVGRYIRRGCISEKRIISYDGQSVRIGYAHPEKHDDNFFTVDSQTFIDRFLSHVPEKGSHLVRSYGLFHPNCISKLNLAREQLGQPACEPVTEVPSAHQLLKKMFPDLETLRCPFCGSELRTVFVCRRGQSSVWRLAA